MSDSIYICEHMAATRPKYRCSLTCKVPTSDIFRFVMCESDTHLVGTALQSSKFDLFPVKDVVGYSLTKLSGDREPEFLDMTGTIALYSPGCCWVLIADMIGV